MSSAIQESQKPFPFFLPLLVSTIIILLWLIPFAGITLQGTGSGAGILGLFEIIAIPATILAPLVYGWKTGDTKGAVIIGVLPFLFVMTLPWILFGEKGGNHPAFTNWVLYIIPLCITGGLGGYFASRRDTISWGIAIILAGAWFWFFLSGIH
jgi:hypothetical protein